MAAGHVLRGLRAGGIGLAVAAAVVAAALAAYHARSREQASAGMGPRFEYSVSSLRTTDPATVKYRQISTIETGLETPVALAIDRDDRVHILGDSKIRSFDAPGRFVSEITLDGPGYALAVGENGTIYMAAGDHIALYARDGRQQARWAGLGDNARLSSIAVRGSDVFVGDAGQRVVWRYDAQGKLIGPIGRKDLERGIDGFIMPSPHLDLAFGSDGLLWANNPGRHRLEAYTPDGDLEHKWGQVSMGVAGFCGCCNPINFAILPDGRFITAEKGIVRVKVYSASGQFDGVVAGPEAFSQPDQANQEDCSGAVLDVAVDSKGRVLVLDPTSRAVRVYEEHAGALQ